MAAHAAAAKKNQDAVATTGKPHPDCSAVRIANAGSRA